MLYVFALVPSLGNVLQVAGVLTSLIVANGGLEATPLALLANFVKSQLFSLHAQTPAMHTAGQLSIH